MKFVKNIRYAFEWLVVLSAGLLIQRLTIVRAAWVGRFLGSLAFDMGASRKIAMKNLRMAFPEKSKGECLDIARGAYRRFGETIVSLIRLPQTSPDEILACYEFDGLDAFDKAKDAKKGAICMSAHFGNWEFMAAVMVALGYPMKIAMGTQSNPRVDRLFIEYRKHVGIEGVRIKNIKDVIRLLKGGEFMAMLGDQDGNKWGVFTKFFGQYASTYDIADILCRKTGCALFFGVSEPLGNGRYRIAVKEIPQTPDNIPQHAASAWRMQQYNQMLEAAIRKHPQQWLWMHNRWKAQPFHRLYDGSPERAQAIAGEIFFDVKSQYWRRSSDNAVVEIPYWK